MAIPHVQAEAVAARLAQERFIYGVSKVPDDKLTWSPSETAKSPLQIAGSLAGFLSFVTMVITNKALPPMDGERPPLPDSREAVNAALEAGFQGLRAAIDGIAEEDLGIGIPAPWMPGVPLNLISWVGMGLGVCSYFQGQLNYSQTIYGDMDPNIPDSWGHG